MLVMDVAGGRKRGRSRRWIECINEDLTAEGLEERNRTRMTGIKRKAEEGVSREEQRPHLKAESVDVDG